ncbi:MAG: glycosyltransferase family A protein [Planctomycetota bacterium]
MTCTLAEMVPHLDRRPWIPTIDIGRGVAAAAPRDKRAALNDITRAMVQGLFTLGDRSLWRMTVFCGLEILEAPEITKLLRAAPNLEVGVRLFTEDADAASITRTDRIAIRVAAFRRAFQVNPLVFRGEVEDFDSALGPELLAQGFEIDSSARPDRLEQPVLPASPWRAAQGSCDLLSPGGGEIIEIPVLQLPGIDLDLHYEMKTKAWDLADDHADRDLPRFIETLEEITRRIKQRVPVVTTFELEALHGPSRWRVQSFLETFGATLASRGCLSAKVTEVDLSAIVGRTAVFPEASLSLGPYSGVNPGEGKLSFCVITNGERPEKLRRLISSIEAQRIPSYEIIVAGRPPSDPRIRQVKAEAAADCGRLGPLRNVCIQAATGDWVVVLDDDFLLVKDWYENLQALRPTKDLLSSEVRLPDGSRFWDHTTIDGPRGHAILDAEEQDEFRYVTGGGGWLISRRALAASEWSEELAFNEAEDVDFSRRLQGMGFQVASARGLVCIHADERYTSIGRRTLLRTLRPSARWVLTELSQQTASQLAVISVQLVRSSNYAEAADVMRYGMKRFPEDAHLRRVERFMICVSGGDLPGSRFAPEGDVLWTETIEFFARRDLSNLVAASGEAAQ